MTKAAVPFRRCRHAAADASSEAAEADPSWSCCTMSLSEDSIVVRNLDLEASSFSDPSIPQPFAASEAE